MKISAEHDDEGTTLVLGNIYSNCVLETSEGNRMAICMRDDTIEFNVLPKAGGNRWYRINMQTMEVEPGAVSQTLVSADSNG